MELSRWGIKANKSWFFFDDEYVCLGSGITSTRSGVATTVDTRIAKGSVKIDGKKAESDVETSKTKSVFSNNAGWYFPRGEALSVKKGTRSKSWGKSWGELNNSGDTAVETAEVLSIIIPHNAPVRNDKYEYIVVPNILERAFMEYMENCPIEIAENSDKVQAVSHNNGVYYAYFADPCEACFSDGVKVKSDKRAMVMLRKSENGEMALSVSSSDKKIKSVTITVTVGERSESVEFKMPQNTDYNERLGESVTKKISL